MPPGTIHMEENLIDTEPAEVVVARNSTEINVVNVPHPQEVS